MQLLYNSELLLFNAMWKLFQRDRVSWWDNAGDDGDSMKLYENLVWNDLCNVVMNWF